MLGPFSSAFFLLLMKAIADTAAMCQQARVKMLLTKISETFLGDLHKAHG